MAIVEADKHSFFSTNVELHSFFGAALLVMPMRSPALPSIRRLPLEAIPRMTITLDDESVRYQKEGRRRGE
jgi:hypothetical protein